MSAPLTVLVADAISEQGVDLLRLAPGFQVTEKTGLTTTELARLLPVHDGVIVRSATQITAALLASPGRLKVIGRAGTGVDNIDLDAATRAGIVVVNTPGGNSVAAAELAVSLLLAMARNIPQAHASMRAGQWERKAHMGVEVAGKTLGLVGLGRVGREVARRAQGCRMEVLGFDPFVSREGMSGTGITCVELDELLQRSDFVSLHLPLTDDTRNMFGAATLARMKDGARLVNCARGGLVDEEALLAALEAGKLAGAALDVFQHEPPTDRRLVDHPRVISTPHLGASTREAQERVGIEVAGKVRDFLATGTILEAVNFPSISKEEYAVLGPVMDLAERLGRFLAQLAQGGMQSLSLRCHGEFNQRPLRPLVMAAVKGVLAPALAEDVSFVNALSLAASRGIQIEDGRSSEATPFAGLLRLTLTTDKGTTTVAGTLFTADHPRVVEVDGVKIECSPAGHLLFFRNRDVPGVVGRIGSILGLAGVNIAGIQLGRANGGGSALSVVNVDSPVDGATLKAIQALPEITVARSLKV